MVILLYKNIFVLSIHILHKKVTLLLCRVTNWVLAENEFILLIVAGDAIAVFDFAIEDFFA